MQSLIKTCIVAHPCSINRMEGEWSVPNSKGWEFSHKKREGLVISAVSDCVSVSVFASLVGVPVGITSSKLGSKVYWVTAGIKTYTSIIKIKRKINDKIVLLEKVILCQV